MAITGANAGGPRWLAFRRLWPPASLSSAVKPLMKIAYILTCTLPLFVLGCKQKTPSAQPQPPPQGQSKTVSDGSVTWTLGATTMNGTNVPLSNITVRAVTNRMSK